MRLFSPFYQCCNVVSGRAEERGASGGRQECHTFTHTTDTVTFNCALLALIGWRVRQTAPKTLAHRILLYFYCKAMWTYKSDESTTTGRALADTMQPSTDVSPRLNLENEQYYCVVEQTAATESLSVQAIVSRAHLLCLFTFSTYPSSLSLPPLFQQPQLHTFYKTFYFFQLSNKCKVSQGRISNKGTRE